MTGNPFFNYDIDSLSFLERAQQQLKLFDKEEDISRLLYAALELRMGIESKLYESLDAAYSANNKRSVLQKEYQSKKLLAELLKMCPEAEEDYVLVVKKTGSRDGFGFRFTPITRTLAKRHGEARGVTSLFIVQINYRMVYQRSCRCGFESFPEAAVGDS